MTALVGVLNIRGAAIAADSAVTITRANDRKIANSANKMLRLSSSQPVSVMICGYLDFLGTPWDIIIRRYRQKRDKVSLPTVQAYVDDFFSYMVSEKKLFSDFYEKDFLRRSLILYFEELRDKVSYVDMEEDDKDTIIRAFRTEIKKSIASNAKLGKCPMFENYTLEQFAEKTSSIIDKYINVQKFDVSSCPFEVYLSIRDDLMAGLMSYVTTRSEKEGTTLVFTGYGEEEDYPTLISARVNDGFDERVGFHITDEDIVHVSPDKPVAICPFAQTDIMYSLLTGATPVFHEVACERGSRMFMDFAKNLREKVCGEENDDDFSYILQEVQYSDLSRSFEKYDKKITSQSSKKWLKTLRNYDLQDMAQLAENLVAITSLERHMKFRDEGVGGPVDLAIITKNHGFTWLSRKSWYHHVDVGGRYGKFGV